MLKYLGMHVTHKVASTLKLPPDELELEAYVMQCDPNTPCRWISPNKKFDVHLVHHDF